MFPNEGDDGVKSRKTHVIMSYLVVVFASTSCMLDGFLQAEVGMSGAQVRVWTGFFEHIVM